MSTTDTRTAVSDPERVPVPIVLTLGCPGVQRWLMQDNDLLQAIGWQFQRIDLIFVDLPSGFIFPTKPQSQGHLLVNQYPGKNALELSHYITTDGFAEDAWDVLSRTVSAKLSDRKLLHNPPLTEEERQRIRLVIIHEGLLSHGSWLYRILPKHGLPHAAFFEFGEKSPIPKRIWLEASDISQEDWPLCTNCNRKARPAGDCFVCENCGTPYSTDGTVIKPEADKFVDAPLCMTCGIKMRPAGIGFICESCGTTSGLD